MATIYPRGDCWYLNWSEGGKQHRKTLGRISAIDAEIHRKAKELELTTGRRLFIASARFEDHLERYLKWHRSEYPDSHWRVAQIAEQHFDAFRGKSLTQIDATDIESWKAERMAVVSRGTVEKELRTLCAVLTRAVKWGEIGESPAKDVEPPKGLNSRPIHWYTKAQLAKLYKRHNGDVWRFMANTGLRRTEALQAKVTDLDFKRGMLKVLSATEARTKSGKWRQIPLSAAGRAAAKALVKRHGRDTGFLLPRITAESLSRNFADNVDALGLEGSLHSLRHSYGAHLVMAGVPLRTVQVLMGHASIATTERYAHLGEDHLRDKAKAVNL